MAKNEATVVEDNAFLVKDDHTNPHILVNNYVISLTARKH